MKTRLLVLLLSLPVMLLAQDSAKIDYDVFAHFPKYNGAFEAYVAVFADKPEHVEFTGRCTIDILVGIGKTGKASVIKILNHVSPEIDSAFVKAILTAPKWKPALLKGKPVNVSFLLHYDLEQDKREGLFIINVDREIWPQGNPKLFYSVSLDDKVFDDIEINPQFKGGDVALNHFIKENSKYPVEAMQRHINGRVYVQFC